MRRLAERDCVTAGDPGACCSAWVKRRPPQPSASTSPHQQLQASIGSRRESSVPGLRLNLSALTLRPLQVEQLEADLEALGPAAGKAGAKQPKGSK